MFVLVLGSRAEREACGRGVARMMERVTGVGVEWRRAFFRAPDPTPHFFLLRVRVRTPARAHPRVLAQSGEHQHPNLLPPPRGAVPLHAAQGQTKKDTSFQCPPASPRSSRRPSTFGEADANSHTHARSHAFAHARMACERDRARRRPAHARFPLCLKRPHSSLLSLFPSLRRAAQVAELLQTVPTAQALNRDQ
jgi:hypothetical protein